VPVELIRSIGFGTVQFEDQVLNLARQARFRYADQLKDCSC
jgi:hypothetical protein